MTARASGQELEVAWEGNLARGYSFVSLGLPVTLDGPHFFVLAFQPSYLYQRLPADVGDQREASPGMGASVGYRFENARWSATMSPGYEVRRTARFRSRDPPEKSTDHGVTALTEVFFEATPLIAIGAVADYSAASGYLWSRAGVVCQITNRRREGPVALAIGPEATAERDPHFSGLGVGGLVAVRLLRSRGSVEVRGGSTWLRYDGGPRSAEAYGGVAWLSEF
jgi:cellulose biosynthesis protein BcsS